MSTSQTKMSTSQTVCLKIDNREEKCKEYYTPTSDILFEQLTFGDFQLCKDGEICFLFERKTPEDLLASIKDGRYKNQKASCLTHFKACQYYYILEGSITYSSQPKHQHDKIIQSAIINTQLRDKIGFFFTRNPKETFEFILSVYQRFKEKPTEYIQASEQTISDVVVHIKRKNTNVWYLQLCQLSSVSEKTADAIYSQYSTMKSLFTASIGKTKDELNTLFSQIKITDPNGKQRKISSKVVEQLIDLVY